MVFLSRSLSLPPREIDFQGKLLQLAASHQHKMADLIRRPEPMQSSPRSSPRDRGSRSPAYPRQDSSGTLKTTISLVPGKTPSVIHTGSFYLVKDIPGKVNQLHSFLKDSPSWSNHKIYENVM